MNRLFLKLAYILKLRNVRLTYAVTVNDEADELTLLLNYLLKNKGNNDKIIVLRDITKEHLAVTKALQSFPNVDVIEAHLSNDFSAFKNHLLKKATGDFLFQIDADEMPANGMLGRLKSKLATKSKCDVFLVPRINIVHDITPEHLAQWKWVQNENGYINFPDYQTRIFQLEKDIKWAGKVHEYLINGKRQCALPHRDDSYCLYHVKNITKQVSQNKFYQKKFDGA